MSAETTKRISSHNETVPERTCFTKKNTVKKRDDWDKGSRSLVGGGSGDYMCVFLEMDEQS